MRHDGSVPDGGFSTSKVEIGLEYSMTWKDLHWIRLWYEICQSGMDDGRIDGPKTGSRLQYP